MTDFELIFLSGFEKTKSWVKHQLDARHDRHYETIDQLNDSACEITKLKRKIKRLERKLKK